MSSTHRVTKVHINCILAFSNVVAIFPLYLQYQQQQWLPFVLTWSTAWSSCIYHLCEVKFNLPGVQRWYGLDKYVRDDVYVPVLLNFDRFCAGLCLLYHIWYYGVRVYRDLSLLVMLIISLSLNVLSEQFGLCGWLSGFLYTHLLWHLLAFVGLGMLYQ
jgi:hypothetical protein